METNKGHVHIDDGWAFVDFQFLILLHSHAFLLMTDGGFQSQFIRRIKRQMKKENNRGVISRPTRNGVASVFAEMIVDDLFREIISGGFLEKHGYYRTYSMLETIRDVWFTMSFANRAIDRYQNEVLELEEDAQALNGADWSYLMFTRGADILSRFAKSCRRSKDYNGIRFGYSQALADRIVHDRQASSFLAMQLTELAPLSKNSERTRFVRRVAWPQFVRRILLARDRGKCAECHKDLTLELVAQPHIDHIVPISKGGCNDIVNLQLLCEACNIGLGNGGRDIRASVPKYLSGGYFVALSTDEMR
jgi:hypothetical protein